jgi:hypothetical protein
MFAVIRHGKSTPLHSILQEKSAVALAAFFRGYASLQNQIKGDDKLQLGERRWAAFLLQIEQK